MNIYDEALNVLEAIRKELQDRLNFPVNLTPEYRGVKKALERAKKVEELLTYQNHYIDSIVIELDRITNKAKASQIEIIKKELE